MRRIVTVWRERGFLASDMAALGAERSWREISLANLEHNVRTLSALMPRGCEMMAVLKTDAYGHGAFWIAARLEQMGLRAFAVATIDEGISLRRYGVRGEILILGYTSVRRARELKKYRLAQTIISLPYARELEEQRIRVRVHLKIDTGMHRLGIPARETGQILEVFSMEHLDVKGIFTHLCCCDSRLEEDVAFTRGQIGQFNGLLRHLKAGGISVPKVHAQSSFGLLNYPDLTYGYVRAGIALYGVLSSPSDNPLCKPSLRPVLSLKTRVALIRRIPEGSSLGYGRCFTAKRESVIAILPAGYGDGYPRNLSNGRGYVLIRGQRAPVAGRICMDQMAVDVTAIPGASVGDAAVLIGRDGGEEITAQEVAQRAGTIGNELLCRLGTRLPVVAKE